MKRKNKPEREKRAFGTRQTIHFLASGNDEGLAVNQGRKEQDEEERISLSHKNRNILRGEKKKGRLCKALRYEQHQQS